MTTYTHLHFRGEDGMGSILPMAKDGLGFREEITGNATFITDGDSSPTSEKFADILERMTRAGLCLQLGSTAPLWNENTVTMDPPIHIGSIMTDDQVENLQRMLRSQDDEIAELRKLAGDVEAAKDILRKSGDPELAACVDAAGGLCNILWAVMLISNARKGELDTTKAQVRANAIRLDKLEAQANTHNIQESAAVRMLRALGNQMDTSADLMRNGTPGDWRTVLDWMRDSGDAIKSFVSTLEPSKPNA